MKGKKKGLGRWCLASSTVARTMQQTNGASRMAAWARDGTPFGGPCWTGQTGTATPPMMCAVCVAAAS